MTPLEIAGKLVSQWSEAHKANPVDVDLGDLEFAIAQAIRDAVAEAYEDAARCCDTERESWDKDMYPAIDGCQWEIRRRAKEVLGGGHGTGD